MDQPSSFRISLPSLGSASAPIITAQSPAPSEDSSTTTSTNDVLLRLTKLQRENDALFGELTLAQKHINSLKFERSLLLDKLHELTSKLEKHKMDTGLAPNAELADDEENEDGIDMAVIDRIMSKVSPAALAQQQLDEQQRKKKTKRVTAKPKATSSPTKKVVEDEDTNTEVSEIDITETEASTGDELASEMDLGGRPPYTNARKAPLPGGSSPPTKKRKSNKASAADVVLKVQSVPMLNDQPVLPIILGIITVESLGAIMYDRPNYHNRRYILPVGFCSSRPYLSAVDPNTSTTYHSRIVDGGMSPIFEVWAEDAPDKIYQAQTSTGAWSSVVRQANTIRSREYSNSASGPDYFGLSNATVAMLIERLPNSDKCINYQFKRFEVVNTTSTSNAQAPGSGVKRKTGEMSSGVNTPLNAHPSSDFIIEDGISRHSTPLSNTAAASSLLSLQSNPMNDN